MVYPAYSKGFAEANSRKARSIGSLPDSFQFAGCIQIFTLYPYFFLIFFEFIPPKAINLAFLLIVSKLNLTVSKYILVLLILKIVITQ